MALTLEHSTGSTREATPTFSQYHQLRCDNEGRWCRYKRIVLPALEDTCVRKNHSRRWCRPHREEKAKPRQWRNQKEPEEITFRCPIRVTISRGGCPIGGMRFRRLQIFARGGRIPNIVFSRSGISVPRITGMRKPPIQKYHGNDWRRHDEEGPTMLPI